MRETVAADRPSAQGKVALPKQRSYHGGNPHEKVPGMASTDFGTLMERARQGDEAAATELIRAYEPQIRRAIRIRLVEPRLQRLLDSADICQSVLRRFLGALHDEELSADNPRQLLAWLVHVARNRFHEALRHLRVIREHLAEAAREAAERSPGDADELPGDRLANREVIALVLERLTEEERRIAVAYAGGASWDELAREQGCGKEALRKRFMRALQRVVAELGLEAE
jgi:RNA polymerase sigma-70 factor (ECF subfamily)